MSEVLPFDEGAQAYRDRKTPDSNPYPEDKDHADNWKHEEWWLGWSQEEECDGESWDWETDSFKDK